MHRVVWLFWVFYFFGIAYNMPIERLNRYKESKQ